MLVIVDEAAGLPDDILDAIEGLLTSANVHLLYIGNPTSGSGRFYDSHRSSQFHKIKISVFDTPNFKYNKITSIDDLRKFKEAKELTALTLPYPQLVTPLWAWDKLQSWGEESPIFESRVLAQFPTEGEDTLIGLHLASQALDKEWTEEEWMMRPRNRVIGIDVARFGSDKTVFTVMDNLKMLDMHWHHGKDTQKTAGKAIAMFKELGWSKEHDRFVVDDTGVGGGVTDRLVEEGYTVLPVNFGSSPENKEDYKNLKAEIFWTLRQVFKSYQIRILDKGKLLAQIPTIRYDYIGGKLAIVGKQKMKSIGIESPDFVDSLALAVWAISRGAMTYQFDPNEGKGLTIVGDLTHKAF